MPNDDETKTRPMSMDEAGAAMAAVARRHSRARDARRTAERRALPLLARLGPNASGRHCFSSVDFRALVGYLTYGSPAEASDARTCGRLRMGRLVLVRDKTLAPEPASPRAKPTEPRMPPQPTCSDHETARLKRRSVAELAEPLLVGLAEGKHYFTPTEFRAIAEFLFEGAPEELGQALKRDRVEFDKITIACRRKPADGTTISAFARAHGIAQQTLHDRAKRAQLRPIRKSGKLLYDCRELAGLLGAPLPAAMP